MARKKNLSHNERAAKANRLRESGQPGGGQGRKDDVGRSAVYPMSGPHASGPVETRTAGAWGQGERGAPGSEDHGSSELTDERGQLLEALETHGDSLAAQPPIPGPRSLAFIVWDNPPIVIGAGSFLDRLAGLAGAHNVFHDIATPSAQVSIETIAARNPDFIAVLSDTAAPPRYAGRPEWRVVPAVRKGRFLVLPGELFGRPGPRAAEAVRELRRRLETTP